MKAKTRRKKLEKAKVRVAPVPPLAPTRRRPEVIPPRKRVTGSGYRGRPGEGDPLSD
jgi:hypothetical protein